MRNALVREVHHRLAWARETAGFEKASDAAIAVGEKAPTYLGHENGWRGFGRAKAAKYSRRYRVSLEWLLTGKGEPRPKVQPAESNGTVPLVGYVAAGSEAHFLPAGDLGDVEAPDGSTPETVAVEIRGDSMGPLFDRWLIYYDDVRRPVTSDLYGRLCIVGLRDGRIMVKKLKKSRSKGLFHLISQADDPILDAELEWAARVKMMVPR